MQHTGLDLVYLVSTWKGAAGSAYRYIMAEQYEIVSHSNTRKQRHSPDLFPENIYPGDGV